MKVSVSRKLVFWYLNICCIISAAMSLIMLNRKELGFVYFLGAFVFIIMANHVYDKNDRWLLRGIKIETIIFYCSLVTILCWAIKEIVVK
jgi:hypothetical protein